MASVLFDGATKRFGETVAVDTLTLPVEDGEFMVLVGPSGCGKTTALRLLAGLEALSAGSIRIGDRVVNDVAPRDRDVAMVFQDYALYPQMTVRQNLAFGLRIRKTDKTEVANRVAAAAEALGIEQLLDRRPRALSGGQRQRVALGRALVRDPQVFLMDEPLSNLDAKLRTQTRAEIRRLQQEVATTTVYVTHDQVEAMTMGDRIAVMNDGRLEQVGEPDVVYEQPANTFVAGFIGSPPMSLARFGSDTSNGRVALVRGNLRLDLDGSAPLPREVIVGTRAEHTRVWDDGAGLVGPVDGHVEYVEALGRETLVGVACDETRFIVEAHGRLRVDPGDELRFGFARGSLYLFDPNDERALGRA
jgi:ABC-type sugar transport system ATPase subunit